MVGTDDFFSDKLRNYCEVCSLILFLFSLVCCAKYWRLGYGNKKSYRFHHGLSWFVMDVSAENPDWLRR